MWRNEASKICLGPGALYTMQEPRLFAVNFQGKADLRVYFFNPLHVYASCSVQWMRYLGTVGQENDSVFQRSMTRSLEASVYHVWHRQTRAELCDKSVV